MNDQVCLPPPSHSHGNQPSSVLTATPLMDIVEHAEGLHLYCNVPGADRENVDLLVDKDVLHLRAKAFLEPLPGRIHALEICDTVYEGTVRLPAAVDVSRVEAFLANGVLRVFLPFPTGKGSVRIPVLVE